MSLGDPLWLRFDGSPIGGKVPTRLNVLSNPPGLALTGAQFAKVEHIYQAFCTQVYLSPAREGYHRAVERLDDGSVVIMESINDVHTVTVLISSVPVRNPYSLFLCVPTVYQFSAGEHLPNSWSEGVKWESYKESAPPVTPKPSGISVFEHPGSTIWTSPHFLDDEGERLILSWKGPPNRYQTNQNGYHCGWFYNYGGINVAYSATGGPYSLSSEAFDQLRDQSLLWVGTRRYVLPVAKIIAASLHRPDPVNAPGNVVLRVCSNRFPQNTTSRAMAVFDLIPASASTKADSTLAGLLAADSFQIADTYGPPASYSPTMRDNLAAAAVGAWEEFSRPHFDDNGDRLALTVFTKIPTGEAGIAVRSVAIPSWEVLEQAVGTSIGSSSSTTTITNDNTTEFRQSVVGSSEQTTRRVGFADFFEGQFVYLWDETIQSTAVNDDTLWLYGTAEGSGTNEFTSTTTWRLVHNVRGDLATRTYARSEASSGSGLLTISPSGSLSTVKSATPLPFCAILADLHRDFILIGTPNGPDEAAKTVTGAPAIQAVIDGNTMEYASEIVAADNDPAIDLTPKVFFGAIERTYTMQPMRVRNAQAATKRAVLRVGRPSTTATGTTVIGPTTSSSSSPIVSTPLTCWGGQTPLFACATCDPDVETAYAGFVFQGVNDTFNSILRASGAGYALPNWRAAQPGGFTGRPDAMLCPIFLPAVQEDE